MTTAATCSGGWGEARSAGDMRCGRSETAHLRCNQLDAGPLPGFLLLDKVEELRIVLLERNTHGG